VKLPSHPVRTGQARWGFPVRKRSFWGSSPLIPAYKAGFVVCAPGQYLPVSMWAVPSTITPHIFCLPEFCGSTAPTLTLFPSRSWIFLIPDFLSNEAIPLLSNLRLFYHFNELLSIKTLWQGQGEFFNDIGVQRGVQRGS